MIFENNIEIFMVKYNIDDKRFNKYLPKQEFLHTALYFNGFIYDYVPKIEGGFRRNTINKFESLFNINQLIKFKIENSKCNFNGLDININNDNIIQNRINEINNLYTNNELFYSCYKIQCTSVILYIISSDYDYFINEDGFNDKIIISLLYNITFVNIFKDIYLEIKDVILNSNKIEDITNNNIFKFTKFLLENINILYEDNSDNDYIRLKNMINDFNNMLVYL